MTGDTKYGTVENIVAIEERAASAPTSRSRRSASGPGCSATQDFVYDAAADAYRCPGDADAALPLPERRDPAADLPSAGGGLRGLRAPRRSARPRQRGRRVSRSLDEAYLDRVRGYHATEPYAKAMRKRKVWVEPLFAEAKDWHGLRRFRLRGSGEGQRRGAADRGRAEPEAPAQPAGLGPAPVPERSRRRRPPALLTPASGGMT